MKSLDLAHVSFMPTMEPESLFDELQDVVASNSAMQRALDAESALRAELEAVREELEQRRRDGEKAQEEAERRAEEERLAREEACAAAAAEAARIQERLEDMQMGAWFDKVGFHRRSPHPRFVR